MEQNREPGHKSTHIWPINLWQRNKEHIMGKDSLFNKGWKSSFSTCSSLGQVKVELQGFLPPTSWSLAAVACLMTKTFVLLVQFFHGFLAREIGLFVGLRVLFLFLFFFLSLPVCVSGLLAFPAPSLDYIR